MLTAFVVLLTLIGSVWTPYDPSAMDFQRLDAPSIQHIMGTDNFGRDIFSRVLQGAKTTLTIALAVVAIGAFFGTLIGAFTGYLGGIVDEVLMRLCDAITAFPNVMLALVIVAILGPGEKNVIWVLGILFIPSFAKVVRGQFTRIKDSYYIRSARLMGAGPLRIIFVHLMPNVLPVLVPSITIGINNAVLAEASMSFLGVGVSADRPSLGRMLSESQNFIVSGAPWYAIGTGLSIVLLILGLSLLGEGLQERRRNS